MNRTEEIRAKLETIRQKFKQNRHEYVLYNLKKKLSMYTSYEDIK